MKKLLLASVFALMVPSFAYAQSDDVKTLMHQEETLNEMCRGGTGDEISTQKACDLRDTIIKQLEKQGWCWGPDDVPGYQQDWVQCEKNTINTSDSQIISPLRMFIKNTEDSYSPPSLYIDYPENAIVNGLNIRIEKHKLELWLLVNTYNKHIPFVILDFGNHSFKLLSVNNNEPPYRYYISYNNTKDFIHNFTSSNSAKITIGDDTAIISLKGSTALFNEFIKSVEDKHISLPPPFKTYENDPLKNQNFDEIAKPTNQKISISTIQKALLELNKVNCSNIQNSLAEIVSSCYKNIANTNEDIDKCVAEDDIASTLLSISHFQNQQSSTSDFFSKENSYIRLQKYKWSRFDDSQKAAFYFLPIFHGSYIGSLGKKCNAR